MISSTKLRFGDVEIARIGLGTNRLTNTPTNVAFIKQAVASGVGMIDTAHTYTGGESEATIGAAPAPVPDTCVVATKGGAGGPGRGRPENVKAEIEESFRRLRTDSIALYYLHRVDTDREKSRRHQGIPRPWQDPSYRHLGGLDRSDRAG